jgi:hypothetical protein
VELSYQIIYHLGEQTKCIPYYGKREEPDLEDLAEILVVSIQRACALASTPE